MSRKLRRKMKRKSGVPTSEHTEYLNLLHQGDLFAQSGRQQSAENAYKKAIKKEPNNSQAYLKLAYFLKDIGELQSAIIYLAEALRINDKQPGVHNDIGLLQFSLKSYENALGSFKKAIELQPDLWFAHYNLSNCLKKIGDIKGAFSECEHALQLNPDIPEIHLNLSRLWQQLSPGDEWLSCCRRAIELNPYFGLAYLQLARGKKFHEHDADITGMENIYDSEQLDIEQKTILGFALGKAYEDLEDYDKAFEFFSTANNMKRQTINYSLQQETERFAWVKNLFTPELLTTPSEIIAGDKTPVFILGMPRSGTSLIEQILAGHSQVSAGGELRFLDQIARPYYAEENFSKLLPDRQESHDLYIRQASHVLKTNGSTIFTDKMPHNFIHIGMIKLLFPEARVIHCRRTPMDTCLSLYKNLFGEGHLYSYDQRILGRYYLLYKDLMEYWQRILPDFIYDIHYEALVEDPEHQIKELLKFCDLKWEEKCLNFHLRKHSIRTLSVNQVRKPIYNDSVGLWMKYGTHLSELKNSLEATR